MISIDNISSKVSNARDEWRRTFGDGWHCRLGGQDSRMRQRTGIASENRDNKPTGEGTGLGLSISCEIVSQQHGGTIEVDSEVGAFTEFTVRLPRGRHVTTELV